MQKTATWELDVLFILTLFIFVVFSWQYHQGPTMYDPGAYLSAAHDLLTGTFNSSNYFSFRIGENALLALAWKIFGYGPRLTLVNGVQFIVLVCLIYWLLRKFSQPIAFISAVFVGSSPFMLRNSGVIMTDMLATLTSNIPLLLIFWFMNERQENRNRSPIICGSVTGLLFASSVLCKESVAFFIPFAVFLHPWTQQVMVRITKGRYHSLYSDTDSTMPRFFNSAVVAFGIGIVACFGLFWVLTGDPLGRFSALATGPSASMDNYTQASLGTVLARITYQPIQFLFLEFSFGIAILFSAIAFMRRSQSRNEQFFKWYLVLVLIPWWVGTQGNPFSGGWNPVVLVHRVWMPVMVPLGIVAAYGMLALSTEDLPKYMRLKMSLVVTVLLVVAMISLQAAENAYMNRGLSMDFNSHKVWYSILAVIIVATPWLKEFEVCIFPRLHQLLVPFVLLSQLGGVFVSYMWQSSHPVASFYEQERRAILRVDQEGEGVVLTDPAIANNYGMYNGFQKKMQFVDYHNYPVDSLSRGIRLLVNKGRLTTSTVELPENAIFTNGRPASIPEFVKNPKTFGFREVWSTDTHIEYQKE